MTYLKSLFLSAGLVAGMGACSQQAEMADMPVKSAASLVDNTKLPQAQLSENVTPTKYNLDLRIDPRTDGFSGVVTIDVQIAEATDKIWLHGQHITVTDGIAKLADGQEVAVSYTEADIQEAPSGVAWLKLAKEIGPGEVTLVLPYETPYNTALNSAYKVTRKGETGTDNYVVTQFEAIGARQAFPGFDEPRFKVPFDLSISAPSEDVVYANTPETQTIAQEDGWTKHVFATTRPLPTYLIAFGVGPWDVVEYADLPPTSVRGHSVPLRGIAVKGEGKNMMYALKNTADILEELEAYFGIPYPYEKLDLIAAPDYAFGAMENPGAIVYTEFLMLMDENASLGQRRAYAGVHAHEMAHQWFGDLVTPVWWEDIWLNEAFASWMGNKAIDAWQPDGNFGRLTLSRALGAMAIDSLTTTRKVREPLVRTENVMDQFDGITYRKGGGVLAMFESYLGEERFQKGVRLHMARFEDKVASADDFFQSLADGSENSEVVPAMKSFVDQSGLPLVSAELNCKSDVHTLQLSQSRYAPHGSAITQGQLWKIPVCASYSVNGETKKSCTLLTEKTGVLNLETQTCPSWVSLNADGAGYYRFSLDADAWAGLLDNVDKLNPREVLTVLDSLKASFAANKMDAETYLNGLSAFAQHSEYDIARQAGNSIATMKTTWLPESAHDDLARFTQDLYAERYARIKDAHNIEADLLAPTLAARLVNFGGDTALAKEFADAGASYLGLDGDANKKALAPNMLGLGLSEVFKVRGEAALPGLMEMVRTGSPAEKGSALNALGNTTDQDIAARLREDALSNTDTFTGRQASGLIAGLLGNSKTQAETWVWFQTNFDAFVEARVADVRRGTMPRYAGGFCDVKSASDVKAFFESKADIIPGYERSLAQTLEGISLCVALKQAKSEELVAALAKR